MIPFFHFFLAPLVAAALTLWAAWLALAAEADADLPRSLSGQIGSSAEGWTLSRDLHVAHLALLVLAGAAAGVAVAWWAWSPAAGLMRLFLAVLLVWVLGDLLPRLLAAVAPELTLPARRAAVATLVPFQPLLRLAGWADARVRERAPVQTTRQAGAAQRDMLLGVFALADTTVAEVMTPRIDIIAVDSASEREEVVKTLQSSEHARLLVYDGHPDEVVGVVYAKDILAVGPEDTRPWRTLIRPAAFVPEAKTLDRQLRDFQRGPGHIAVVVDEYGGTSGLITLEDILEQIVGEIQDEHDRTPASVERLPDGSYWVSARAHIDELNEALDWSLPKQDYETVAGLVLAILHRIPRTGEEFQIPGYTITVLEADARRVKAVKIAPLTAPAATAGAA